MIDEGYIKFNSELHRTPPPSEWVVEEVNTWRDRMYALGYIGAYEGGIGYGNISVRSDLLNEFIVTGSGTGTIPILFADHFTRVSSYSIDDNSVVCEGQIDASSESMTHAAVYACAPEARAVIHIHSREHWDKLLNKIPTTSEDAAYGTPEMAREIKRLFDETNFREIRVMVMAGHDEGILSYGASLKEAGTRLLDVLQGKLP
ncbi:MAG: class II aldolase/adducin family protein [bacterium]|nr:class II aldolase/adducin family protein [bacterium]